MPEFKLCPDCWSQHLGPACGMTFAQRMKTVRLDTMSFDTSDKTNYFDTDAVRDLVGPDAEERMMDETDGRGFIPREQIADTPTDVLADYVYGPETDDVV